METEKNRLLKAFNEYVAAYDADNPKIRLKIDHSLRVATLSEEIARTVGGAKAGLAWTTGLLHDIGRFEQVRRYHTFLDAKSVDHAGLGADLLFREGLLEELLGKEPSEEFPADRLPEHGIRQPLQERHLMEKAIRNHSTYRLPVELTAEEQMYCDILRDADKIDIFRVMCDTPVEEIYDVTTKELKDAQVSEAVKECFRNRMTVLRSLKRTPADSIAGHICMAFELVYPVSRKIAKEQGYVDQLLCFNSNNPDTAAWFAYMREHIWE